MTVLEEARAWLETMKAHTHCCGTPMVRKMVDRVVALEQQIATGFCADCGRKHGKTEFCGPLAPVSATSKE